MSLSLVMPATRSAWPLARSNAGSGPVAVAARALVRPGIAGGVRSATVRPVPSAAREVAIMVSGTLASSAAGMLPPGMRTIIARAIALPFSRRSSSAGGGPFSSIVSAPGTAWRAQPAGSVTV